MVHFAGHGLAFPNAEEESFLALDLDAEPKQTLTVEGISSQPRPLELLVLSACETHAGKVDQSEGVISLARSATLAGARSVVSTLWQVPQKDKPGFFEDYYQFLTSGAPRSEALCLAQRKLLARSPKLNHPYYWAAYINLGDGGPIPEELLP
ncbi:MAG: CHAT domain-containing protein [Bacteroidota bacterium]